MAQWVLWDDKDGRLLSVMRNLPAALRGKDAAQLAQLGYHERLIRQPEDFIPRFPGLLGSSKFTLLEDGRVLEEFPEADYSVESVRNEVKRMVKENATQALGQTDWYVIRSMELDKPIPADVVKLRKNIRDHVEWVLNDLDSTNARALVDYQWKMPSEPDQVMVAGAPVIFNPTPPAGVPVPPMPTDPAKPVPTNILHGTTEDVLDPAPEPPEGEEIEDPPPTTDGPVPRYVSGQEIIHLDANDVPLVTVYAPNVEDIGPRPAQDQE